MITRNILAILLGAVILPLSGCAPLAVFGAVGTTGVIMSDRRTNAVMLEDQEIESQVKKAVRDLPYGSKNHINNVSYNHAVLLAGEVHTREIGLTLEDEVKKIPGVTNVYNELVIAPASSFGERSQDTLLTTKVKSEIALLTISPDFYAGHVKVVTERGIVYLMGLLKPSEMQPVIDRARSVSGVIEVVPLFETYYPEKKDK
ncbi:BON domain-containing protein [Wohlfahrtiimonas larvae]|uniref:BON domain-containing protein n=1 Tax=Wohlfahrtiimonas larvae TaxID=1157986 RepID=A0ABP9MGR8_9GAMM|nr:BON domain-containing protein [Wohlfahrtiimonas larvae]